MPAHYAPGKSIVPAGRPANTPAVAGSRRLSDAQVLTTALGFFGGNLVVAKRYMEQHWGQNRLDKSGFTRRLHALADTLHALFSLVGDWLKQRHLEARYVLDSFPVAVCHNTRIPRCKLLMGKAYYRRCASKRSWFYGLKVQVVATSDGIPVEFYLPARAESEQTGRRGLALYLPEGSLLYSTPMLANLCPHFAPSWLIGRNLGLLAKYQARFDLPADMPADLGPHWPDPTPR